MNPKCAEELLHTRKTRRFLISVWLTRMTSSTRSWLGCFSLHLSAIAAFTAAHTNHGKVANKKGIRFNRIQQGRCENALKISCASDENFSEQRLLCVRDGLRHVIGSEQAVLLGCLQVHFGLGNSGLWLLLSSCVAAQIQIAGG